MPAKNFFAHAQKNKNGHLVLCYGATKRNFLHMHAGSFQLVQGVPKNKVWEEAPAVCSSVETLPLSACLSIM